MDHDRVGQPGVLSPLLKNRLPAVGSSTSKDRRWQNRSSTTGMSRFHPGSAAVSGGEGTRKKVEGRAVPAQAEGGQRVPRPAQGRQQQPASSSSTSSSGSRIPLGPRTSAPDDVTQQQPATASRIPCPPHPLEQPSSSPQDLVAALATPAVPGALLEDMPLADSTPVLGQGSPGGFHTYNNPSFNVDQFLASMAQEQGVLPTSVLPASEPAASLADWVAELPASRGAAAGATGSASTTQQTVQAEAGGQPPPLAKRQGQSTQTNTPVGGAVSATSKAMPTPEALQLLQHLNTESPQAGQGGAKGERRCEADFAVSGWSVKC